MLLKYSTYFYPHNINSSIFFVIFKVVINSYVLNFEVIAMDAEKAECILVYQACQNFRIFREHSEVPWKHYRYYETSWLSRTPLRELYNITLLTT